MDEARERTEREALEHERMALLVELERWLEVPMLVLGFGWLVIVGVELLWEDVWLRNPILETISIGIWGLFIVNFVVELILAPRKLAYLKRNWLTALALAVPALRLFRIIRVLRAVRAARAVRGVRLVRVVGSLNRGMRALSASMSRRGFGYVAALTVIVTIGGAAGMYAFEKDQPQGFYSFGDALWWTTMLMTTMGSAYWPQTPEGRVLCVLLALYAFAGFGYVTAALATYFIGKDADPDTAQVAGAQGLAELKAHILALRREVAALSSHGAIKAEGTAAQGPDQT